MYEYNNDDRLFVAEENIIKEISKSSCVIVGRCADYILKHNDEVIKVFLYSDDNNKVKRSCTYYRLSENNALKEIRKINKQRAKHYKYYTNRDWYNTSNYDLMINVDKYGVERVAQLIENYINS